MTKYSANVLLNCVPLPIKLYEAFSFRNFRLNFRNNESRLLLLNGSESALRSVKSWNRQQHAKAAHPLIFTIQRKQTNRAGAACRAIAGLGIEARLVAGADGTSWPSRPDFHVHLFKPTQSERVLLYGIDIPERPRESELWPLDS